MSTTQHGSASLALLILLGSSLLISTHAEFNNGNRVTMNDDLNYYKTTLSPEKCYLGSDGIADSCKWPGGVFIYDIDDALFSSAQLQVIKEVHHQISEATGHCVTFRRKTVTDATYVSITKSIGCVSPVGRRIGRSKMSLADACFSAKTPTAWVTMIHMLSLGLWVEHGREDRDEYVKVLEENIYEDFLPLFEKVNGTTYGTPYDYGSLMHFAEFAYSRTGYRTIVPYNSSVTIGLGTYMSELDAKKLMNMYSCD